MAALLLVSTGCASGSTGHDAAATPGTSTSATAASPASPATSTDSSAGRTTSAPSTGTSIGPTSTSGAPTNPPEHLVLDGRTVVLDPGHNGANGAHPAEIGRLVDAGGFQKACNTTGTAEGELRESTVNLLLAEAVRDELVDAGATVVLTRTDDDGWGPCIDERGGAAALHGADVLISLHADGAAAAAHGFHVIHQAPVAGYVDDGLAVRSADLAEAVRDRLVGAGLTPSTYIGGGTGLDQRSDLGTLNRSSAPAIMIETGNMHHTADLGAMRDPEWRATVAEAIVTALIDDLDTRVGP